MFVSDMIAAVKICQAEIYMMYCDSYTSFQPIHFQLFSDVVANHSHMISQEWVTNLNDGSETLAYRINNHIYPAHLTDYVTEVRKYVGREEFDIVVSAVKGQCKAIAELLISQLEKRFPKSEIMEALGIVFPQYWL